jgi:hypothetical protein
MKKVMVAIKEYAAAHRRILAEALILLFIVGVGVTVTVVKVNERKLTGIEVEQMPAKTEYVEGQALDTEGLVVRANYSNGKSIRKRA